MRLRHLIAFLFSLFALSSPLPPSRLSMPIPRCGTSRDRRAKSICSAPSIFCPRTSTGARPRSTPPWRGRMSSSSKSRPTKRRKAEIRKLVARDGHPAGGAIAPRRCCRQSARDDFDAAIKSAHLPPDLVDHEKPWLVSLQLAGGRRHRQALFRRRGRRSCGDGDRRAQTHKPVRYFETIEQQLRLLAGGDDSLQIDEFASDLKDYPKRR